MGPLKLLTVADVAERCQLGETAARYLHLYGGRLEDMARKLGGVR